ncbi:MAG: Jag N-terminal domain-containing protein, partial [Krumholzibacteria bacterium]|nr:Jag N-terminal domain-containing protein [Candidatus Krumholzibacteria bacterium]
MTDKVEIQGKTVDEAVSEALLRMGARRDEVDVTVLEEPKNGLFGFLGGRPARVIVRRRAGGRSRGRVGRPG